MSLRLSAGEAVITGVRVPVAPEGDAGALRVGGAGGPVVRPLTFGERWRVVRYAWTSPDPVGEVVAGVRTVATGGISDRENGERNSDGIVDVLALHLAGAGSGAPGFATVTAILARSLGWGPEEVAASDAVLADDVARGAGDAEPEDQWNRVVFPVGSVPGNAVRVRDDLAADLLRRGVEPVDIQVETGSGIFGGSGDQPVALAGGQVGDTSAPPVARWDAERSAPEAGDQAPSAAAGGIRMQPASARLGLAPGGAYDFTGGGVAPADGAEVPQPDADATVPTLRVAPAETGSEAPPRRDGEPATGDAAGAAAGEAGARSAEEPAGSVTSVAAAGPTSGATSVARRPATAVPMPLLRRGPRRPATVELAALAPASAPPVPWSPNGGQGQPPEGDRDAPLAVPSVGAIRGPACSDAWDHAWPPLSGPAPPTAGTAVDADRHAELLADAFAAELHRIADLRGIDR